MYDAVILTRIVFDDDYTFYPQVFSEKCLYKLGE